MVDWSDFEETDSEVQMLSAPDRIEFTLPTSTGGALFVRLAVTTV